VYLVANNNDSKCKSRYNKNKSGKNIKKIAISIQHENKLEKITMYIITVRIS
jgi:hypothetical protein